jgi:hypothetical protein
MTRKVYTTFHGREAQELKKKELEVSTHKLIYNYMEPNFLAADEAITKSIKMIQESALEEELKNLILTSIEQLETTLTEETNHALMIKKYNALSNMLKKIVVERSSSPEDKEKAFDVFLEAFKEPSSNIQNKAKLGLAIGLIIFVLGLGIAAYFLFQLIPFTAFFTMIGITGAAVTILSNGTSLVGQIVLSMLATWGLKEFNDAIYNPLCKGIQRLSQEYRDAAAVKNSMQHLFFTTPSLISEGELTTSPLLDTRSPEII